MKLIWNTKKMPQAKECWIKDNNSVMLNAYRFFRRYTFISQSPHVDGEGDVFSHDQAVGDGDAGEDHVDGVLHVPVGEHQDVGQVEDDSEDTDHHGQPAVD